MCVDENRQMLSHRDNISPQFDRELYLFPSYKKFSLLTSVTNALVT